MDPSNCIIHYDSIFISEKLHQFTSTTLKTLKKNKVARISLGGDNLYQLQSAGRPETLAKNYDNGDQAFNIAYFVLPLPMTYIFMNLCFILLLLNQR